MQQGVSRGYQYDDHKTTVQLVPRRDFIYDLWDYGDGQDVTFIGPSHRGKTTLSHQLLRRSISPERRCVILAGKPPHRDPVMAKAAERLNLRIVESWPPSRNPRDRKRNGWVLRPKHTLVDPDEDDRELHDQFQKAVLWSYSETRAPTVIVIDERHHVENDLKVSVKVLDAPLLRGQPHSGEWNLLQRGRWISYNVYSAPEHVFVFYDPTQVEQKRYGEIGGVDPDLIVEISGRLKTRRLPSGAVISQCLYIKRSSQELFVVDT